MFGSIVGPALSASPPPILPIFLRICPWSFNFDLHTPLLTDCDIIIFAFICFAIKFQWFCVYECIIELYVFMMHIFKCDFPNIIIIITVLSGSFTYRICVSVLNNLKNLLFLKVIALLKISHHEVCWYSISHPVIHSLCYNIHPCLQYSNVYDNK